MRQFISEDELDTFEGFLKYQAVDVATTSSADLAMWRSEFDESMARRKTAPKVGLMKLQSVPGEHRYAVAFGEGSDLWITLWVRRSRKGEFFVMIPRNRDWDPHTSYHRNGRLHMKSYGRIIGSPEKRQPLTDTFRGREPLGAYSGHGPKSVGAVCDPNAFSGVMKVPPGILGPRDGMVMIDLIEPSSTPISYANTVQQEIFRDIVPWIVITICSSVYDADG